MLKHLSEILMLAALAVSVSLAGCSDDAVGDGDAGQESYAGNIFVRLKMNLWDNGLPDKSHVAARAGEDTSEEATTPGTSREDATNTIDLLVYDNETNKLIDIVSLNKEEIRQIASTEGLTTALYVKDVKTVRIKIVVNMPERVRSLFSLGLVGDDVPVVSTGNSYWDVINEFAPDSDGSQEAFEANGTGGIMMTGDFTAEGSNDPVITVEKNNKLTVDNPLKLSSKVCRAVAKIHVLVKAVGKQISTGETIEYANAKADEYTAPLADGTGTGGDEYSNWIGWIRRENVRYLPNGTNKSTYIFPQSEEGTPKDLNMNLDEYVSTGKDTEIRGMDFDAPKWNRDFAFYNGVALHKENVSPDSHFAKAETFNQTRLDATTGGTTADNRYVKGMYCLENYFDASANFEDDFNSLADAIPMVTHVSVTAKLTPRHILILKDYLSSMDAFVKAYRDNPETFRKEYGLAEEDFTMDDVRRWEGEFVTNDDNTTTQEKEGIRDRYKAEFEGEDNLYRNDFRIIKTASEADAADIINWSMKANKLWTKDPLDFERGKYPDGTFYVYNREYNSQIALDTSNEKIDWTQQYLYMTAGVVAKATGKNDFLKTYSVPHLGGWGYYYTYIDNVGNTPSGELPSYIKSQVTRNTYYIITVGNFGGPGGTITRPEYIKVNTEPVGWDYAGKGVVNLH